jgi:hypothetical protein
MTPIASPKAKITRPRFTAASFVASYRPARPAARWRRGYQGRGAPPSAEGRIRGGTGVAGAA